MQDAKTSASAARESEREIDIYIYTHGNRALVGELVNRPGLYYGGVSRTTNYDQKKTTSI